MLCAYLAAGLLANALFGLWWVDPTVGLAIAAIAVHEGRETWRGEGCCAGAPITGESGNAYRDDCCA